MDVLVVATPKDARFGRSTGRTTTTATVTSGTAAVPQQDMGCFLVVGYFGGVWFLFLLFFFRWQSGWVDLFHGSQWYERTKLLSASTAHCHGLGGIVLGSILFIRCRVGTSTLGPSGSSLAPLESCGNHLWRRLIGIVRMIALEVHASLILRIVVVVVWMLILVLLLELTLSQDGSLGGDQRHSNL